jgi:uncharacterized protein (DUF1684 family)
MNMQMNFKAIAISSLALCATAAFAANQAQVNVPFSFSAEGHAYPAGTYEVALDANHNVVTMASKMDATQHISWTVGPTDAASSPAVIKFDRVGADYSLKTIQMGERVTPVLDKNVQPSVSATTSISGQ